MIEFAEPERRGLADVLREMPVQIAEIVTSFPIYQHIEPKSSGGCPEGEPQRGSNESWRRPGAGHEVPTARDVGSVTHEGSVTEAMSITGEDSLRRKTVHLVRERLDSDVDDPLQQHGRGLVQDDVKCAPGSEAVRWRLATSV